MNATQISSHHDEKNHHATILFWIEGVGVASVGVLGLCVNLFAIWKLSFGLRNKERHAFHHLLLSLSICDLTHVLLTFTCFSLPQLSNAYRSKVLFYMLPFVIPLAQMSLSCSSFTTVALTVERYISICKPFLRYRFDIKSWYYIVIVVTFSVIYNTPRFFEWMTISEPIERPCLSSYSSLSTLYQKVSPLNNDDKSLNANTFDFPLPDMDVFSDLNALDDAALQRIIQANYEDSVYDYETSYVDPSNVDAPENDVVMFEDMHNCTETFWNVSLVPRALRKNPTYVLIYINWMNFIVNLMLPLGALLFMNLSIYKGLQKLHGHSSTDNKERKKSSVVDFGASLLNNSEEEEERERDARFARASILMVVAFGLCHTPRLISNTVEMFIDHKDLPEWFEILVCVNHLLVTINSSVNFLIYLMGSKRKTGNKEDRYYQAVETTTIELRESRNSRNQP